MTDVVYDVRAFATCAARTESTSCLFASSDMGCHSYGSSCASTHNQTPVSVVSFVRTRSRVHPPIRLIRKKNSP